ncbi:MAG TPA: hypothetical protein VJH23_05730 [archaeon]|nr:hypothetical protein [archaeon]
MNRVFSYSAVNKSKYDFAFASENSFFLAAAFASIIIPIVLHSQAFPNQLIVGTIVNALLALCALFLDFKKSIPVILLPAIAALASGFVFGAFTPALLFLVPFIWAGNAVYVYALKSLKVVNGSNYILSLVCSSLLKAALIGVGTFILILAGLVPEILLIPMSLVQFATAVLGGAIAGSALYLRK